MMTEDLIVSGDILHGKTTRNVAYVVVEKPGNTVVGNLSLPDAATFASEFSINVKLSRRSDAYDVGTFNDAGEFVSANFTINLSESTAVPTRAGRDLS